LVFLLLAYSFVVSVYKTWVAILIVVVYIAAIIVAEVYLAHATFNTVMATGLGFFIFGSHMVYTTHSYSIGQSFYGLETDDYCLGAMCLWFDLWSLITNVFKCLDFCE